MFVDNLSSLDLLGKIFLGIMLIVLAGFIVNLVNFIKSLSKINTPKNDPGLTESEDHNNRTFKNISRSRKFWVSLVGILIFGGIILNVLQGLFHAVVDYR